MYAQTRSSQEQVMMSQSIQTVKLLVSSSLRKLLRRSAGLPRKVARKLRRQLASYIGVLPDFLIIGAQKCGTTSLYHYLVQHPCIYPASIKEVGFFDQYLKYRKGVRWYRSHFPSFLHKYLVKTVL